MGCAACAHIMDTMKRTEEGTIETSRLRPVLVRSASSLFFDAHQSYKNKEIADRSLVAAWVTRTVNIKSFFRLLGHKIGRHAQHWHHWGPWTIFVRATWTLILCLRSQMIERSERCSTPCCFNRISRQCMQVSSFRSAWATCSLQKLSVTSPGIIGKGKRDRRETVSVPSVNQVIWFADRRPRDFSFRSLIHAKKMTYTTHKAILYCSKWLQYGLSRDAEWRSEGCAESCDLRNADEIKDTISISTDNVEKFYDNLMPVWADIATPWFYPRWSLSILISQHSKCCGTSVLHGGHEC